MLVPVWIPTVVLRQIGLGMRPRVYPGKSHASIRGIQPSNKCFPPRVGGTSAPACYLFLFQKHISIKPSGIQSAFARSLKCFVLFVNLQRDCFELYALMVRSDIVHRLYHPVAKSLQSRQVTQRGLSCSASTAATTRTS